MRQVGALTHIYSLFALTNSSSVGLSQSGVHCGKYGCDQQMFSDVVRVIGPITSPLFKKF